MFVLKMKTIKSFSRGYRLIPFPYACCSSCDEKNIDIWVFAQNLINQMGFSYVINYWCCKNWKSLQVYNLINLFVFNGNWLIDKLLYCLLRFFIHELFILLLLALFWCYHFVMSLDCLCRDVLEATSLKLRILLI
jgi:hypothetical protein